MFLLTAIVEASMCGELASLVYSINLEQIKYTSKIENVKNAMVRQEMHVDLQKEVIEFVKETYISYKN